EGPGSEDGRKEFGSPEDALALFDLPSNTPLKVITARFRKLAKELHPDANGGDRCHEPKLRKLIAAYQLLKEHFASK
ncbi:MAG TPA: J domain-containing protein, partial [Nitrospiria bacterium]|nr:J domain-containing protein [Nitrospiria bacterium]